MKQNDRNMKKLLLVGNRNYLVVYEDLLFRSLSFNEVFLLVWIWYIWKRYWTRKYSAWAKILWWHTKNEVKSNPNIIQQIKFFEILEQIENNLDEYLLISKVIHIVLQKM
jgi:hypothetical protein